LFENKDVLPNFNLITIKAPQTIGFNHSEFTNWEEAFCYLKSEIDKVNFDIAIIGCGSYGFPLGGYIKTIGKKAIHLGGATQILFGIKGKRWENNSNRIIEFYNDYWVRPNEKEKPKNYENIEGGCYW
jgi:hypothetical protein